MKINHYFIMGLLAGGCVLWGVSAYVESQAAAIESAIRNQIELQRDVLASIASLPGERTAESVYETKAMACQPALQERFDALLIRLTQLSESELYEASLLFEACAHSDAVQKATIAKALERELVAYDAYIALLSELDTGAAAVDFKRADWGRLLDLEQQRAALSAHRVLLQGQIIEALQNGTKPSDPIITDKVLEARELIERYAVLNARVAELQSNLSDE